MAVQVDLDKCEGCGDCVEACPSESLKIEDKKVKVDPDACIDCNACVDACPKQALSPA